MHALTPEEGALTRDEDAPNLSTPFNVVNMFLARCSRHLCRSTIAKQRQATSRGSPNLLRSWTTTDRQTLVLDSRVSNATDLLEDTGQRQTHLIEIGTNGERAFELRDRLVRLVPRHEQDGVSAVCVCFRRLGVDALPIVRRRFVQPPALGAQTRAQQPGARV